jgi:hypothetical protein
MTDSLLPILFSNGTCHYSEKPPIDSFFNTLPFSASTAIGLLVGFAGFPTYMFGIYLRELATAKAENLLLDNSTVKVTVANRGTLIRRTGISFSSRSKIGKKFSPDNVENIIQATGQVTDIIMCLAMNSFFPSNKVARFLIMPTALRMSLNCLPIFLDPKNFFRGNGSKYFQDHPLFKISRNGGTLLSCAIVIATVAVSKACLTLDQEVC